MNFDKNNFPKISIVTPSFNQGIYLEETILSVLNQNYPNLEYIIIDGGSTDNSVEIIKKYEKYLAYWVSEKDDGQSHAINKGLKKCSGEIFNWLNSDDCYLPDTLRKVGAEFLNPNTFVVCGKSNIINPDGKIIFAEGTFFDPNNLEKTLAVLHIEQPATFFRMSAVKKMGNLSERLHFVMDKAWWLIYLLNFGTQNVVKSDAFFVNFRKHKKSKSFLYFDQFYDEHASILHSIALQKGKKNEAQLLEIKYNILKNFNFVATGLSDKIFSRMMTYFLLKRGNLIFTKKDFFHAQQLVKIIGSEKNLLDENEKNLFEKMQKKIALKYWILFKITRKINFFSEKIN